MKPYYSRDGITIYHGDALAVMSGLQSESIDVFVTDPPYGTRGAMRDGWMVGEHSNIMPLVLPEFYRLGVKDAALYLFTSWMNMADWCFRCSPYFKMQGFLVWDKGRHSGTFGAYSWQFHWEGVYYGIKGPRTVREYMPDVIRISEKPSESMEKPVSVMGRLIKASTDIGQTVLDPFIGTGPTLEAAKALGRKAIGIEIEERYCEIAANRLSQGVFEFSE
jgi:DNA modification methylase